MGLSRVVLLLVVAVLSVVLPGGCAGSKGPSGPATRIHGTVRGHDGRVPTLAHVRVIDPATQASEDTQVRRDGGFVLKSRRRGLAWLELSGVGHAVLRVPIVLDGEPIAVTAKLGTYAPGDANAPVEAYAWTSDPARSEPTIAPLVRGPDGALVGELPVRARRVAVQLVNLAGGGRSVNPPGADEYKYDGAGDYFGMFEPKDGKLRIVVAPADLPKGVAPRLELAPADASAARLAALGEHWQTMLRPSTPADTTALWARARESDDALVRRVATAMALTIERRRGDELAAKERELATALIESTPFGDSLWAMLPDGLARAADLTGDPAHGKLLDRVLAEQLAPEQSAMVLLGRLALASARGDEARARALYARLSSSPYVELGILEVASAWNPDRKLKAGATLPSFEAAALGEGRVASDALRGKVVLIELWATWCQPCVEGMDELHDVYRDLGGERSDGRRFEILSISMDEGQDEVVAFRKRWPMPWLHGFAGKDREKLYTLFETATLPFSVLVDEQGKVLAATAAIEPGRLRGWVEQHLPPP